MAEFFEDSELVIAQQYLRTDFDWRIGVLDGRAIYACKYHMAKGHWQIAKQCDPDDNEEVATKGNAVQISELERGHGLKRSTPKLRFGECETFPVETAPRKAVAIAVKAAGLIGNGLYGVDVKEVDGTFMIIEVNDNPNLDSGVEDAVLRDELYRRIAESFLRRIESIKQ